jgi:anti-sigma28 factor (negative regulator of flagellin synthesis)
MPGFLLAARLQSMYISNSRLSTRSHRTHGEEVKMQISGNFSVSGIDAARSASRSNAVSAPANDAISAIANPVDQLDLSPEALTVNESSAASETFRADKVASLREAIAQWNYDSEERLSAALDNFLNQLG